MLRFWTLRKLDATHTHTHLYVYAVNIEDYGCIVYVEDHHLEATAEYQRLLQ